MNISRDLDPLPVQRTQISFKGKRKHTAYVNIPNLDYKYQHIDIEIKHNSKELCHCYCAR